MSCKDCKYKGQYFPHLDNYHPEIPVKKEPNKWYNCDYPLPCYAQPQAIMEHWGEGCKAYVKNIIKQQE